MTKGRTDQIEERIELLERAVYRILRNVSAAGALLVGTRHDEKEDGR